ncbi:ATP-dependent helicase [Nonomuraea sp. FMUSA5-5]|uniref:DNA 3'-5' helicase n=1 Tax=Nonomuraea composti TaxID=2720023 RepID=A0ABX1BL53_9ACTN|nr:ATP-dependent helicase [Nonomuraea sp. FMUSA5-5]NJP98456.1 ATP-dependent helicase [Nonomuraea sp. FMUSA5-5]
MMSDHPELSDEQKAAVHAEAPFFLHACPGAGKTRVLVARHMCTPEGFQRRGRALISFTNRAADEIKNRCERRELLAPPHFVGTLDVFLWRFLVRPFLPCGEEVWRRLNDWSELPDSPKVLERASLAAYEFAYEPATRGVRVSLPNAERHLKNSPYPVDVHCRAAESVRQSMVDKHRVVTGLEVRLMALANVTDPAVCELLRNRFDEIAIDEAQDCDQLELEILGNLHEHGVPLIVVADPHQSIYEYKGCEPADFHAFTRKFPEPLTLTGNHRSSRTICQAAATMRRPNTPADRPRGPWSDDHHPVLLIPFASRQADKTATAIGHPADALSVFLEHGDQLHPPAAGSLSLAYVGKDVARHGRPTPHISKSRSSGIRLAWAAATFHDPRANARQLDAAARIALHLLCQQWFPGESGSVEAVLANHDMGMPEARRYATTLLRQLPAIDDRLATDWLREANKLVGESPRPIGSANDWTSPLKLKTDERPKRIRELVDLPTALPEEDASTVKVIASTVHKAKGTEADAVLITLRAPKAVKELLDAWRAPSTSEILRIYYVALTRARRLVGFTYPYVSHQSFTAHLSNLRIPFTEVGLSGPLTAPPRRQHLPSQGQQEIF